MTTKGNRIAIYDVAAKHCQTVQGCIDRLHELGATHELKLLTSRLQRLAFRATPTEGERDVAAHPAGARGSARPNWGRLIGG